VKAHHLMSLATVLAIAACKKEAAPEPTTNIVTIHAADYAFTAPDSIPAGMTTLQLVNAGPSLHHLQLVRLDSGRTMDSLAAALSHPGPFPGWATLVAGPNPPQQGDTAWVTTMLTPGQYAMLCLIPDTTGMPHFAKGMMRALTVTTAMGPMAAEPVADAEIHLTDYTFTESAPLTAGRHTIKITNDAQQPHEMLIVRLDSTTTAAQIATWGEHGLRGRQPPSRSMGGVSGLAPGAHTFVTVTLAPGRYGLICFFPDAKDGKSHWTHGMIKEITIS